MTTMGPPAERALTWNVADWVPAAMKTLAGVEITPERPVWVMVTVSPPGGAGESRVTVKLPTPPGASSRSSGLRVTVYWPTNTVEESLAPPSPGSSVAVTVTGPPAVRPSQVKVYVEDPCGMVMVKVESLGGSPGSPAQSRSMTPAGPASCTVTCAPPAGAGEESWMVRVPLPPTGRLRFSGVSRMPSAPTVTCEVSVSPPRLTGSVAVTATGPPPVRPFT